ncbi:hypothetical protein EDB89DRAFT_1910841 [Lactarius sanguifluus]|nr:hypothetical protein EDB89DRAFT_1910841 [Lactarius sanguifluus]
MLPRRQTARAYAPYPSRDPPTSLPLLSPPMEQRHSFQIPLPPPFPYHVQPLAGNPPVAGAQYYPPAYPLMHYPQVDPRASFGTGQLQPWEYAHHPMAPPQPVALRPGGSPAGEIGALVLEGTRAHMDAGRVEQGKSSGAEGTTAAPAQGPGGRTKKNHPNKQLSEGAWEFMVDVTDSHLKHTFCAHTGVGWKDFEERAKGQFDLARDDVRLAYCLNGEKRHAMTHLSCESDWNTAMVRMREKVVSVRTCAVAMELANTNARVTVPKGKGKGKQKRCRNNNIPPAPSPEVKNQYEHLLELQRHLLCHTHSSDGVKAYCWNAPGRGHRDINHENMTKWAKYIALKKTSKHVPLNIETFDPPPAKKRKGTRAPPEVHIAVNITPTAGPAGTALQGSYVVSDYSIVQPLPVSALGSLAPAGVSNDTPRCKPLSDLAPTPAPHGPCNPGSSLIPMLDHLAHSTVLTISKLLTMMDRHNPKRGQKYVDICSEFEDFAIHNPVDLFELGEIHLSTFGSLDRDEAHRLYEFTRDNVLSPLGLLKTVSSTELSVQEVPAPTQAILEQAKQDNLRTPLEILKTRPSEEPSIQEVATPTQAFVKQATPDNMVDGDDIETGDDTGYGDETEESDDIEEGDGQPTKDERNEAVLEWLSGVESYEEGSDVSQEI